MDNREKESRTNEEEESFVIEKHSLSDLQGDLARWVVVNPDHAVET